MRELRSHRIATRGIGALLFSLTLIGAAVSPTGALGLLPPSNPATNVQPVPNFLSSGACVASSAAHTCANPCVTLVRIGASLRPAFPRYANTAACAAFQLRAINAARTAEHLPLMVLPTNWISLSAPEQLFVLADLERTARGLAPYLGLNRALTNAAQRAALNRADPNFAPGFRVGIDVQNVRGMGSTLALGYSTLEADYTWMYEDGWGGSMARTPNVTCSSPSAPGCWGHRDQLLGSDGHYNPGVGLDCSNCEMGTGFAVVKGTGSFTDLIELPAGAPPAMYFTWAKNVLPFLPQ
jgi:hypothetical protein